MGAVTEGFVRRVPAAAEEHGLLCINDITIRTLDADRASHFKGTSFNNFEYSLFVLHRWSFIL